MLLSVSHFAIRLHIIHMGTMLPDILLAFLRILQLNKPKAHHTIWLHGIFSFPFLILIRLNSLFNDSFLYIGIHICSLNTELLQHRDSGMRYVVR